MADEGDDQSEALRQALQQLSAERSRANSLHERLQRNRQEANQVRSQRHAMRRRGMSMLQTTMNLRRRAATVNLFRMNSSQSTDESEDEGQYSWSSGFSGLLISASR